MGETFGTILGNLSCVPEICGKLLTFVNLLKTFGKLKLVSFGKCVGNFVDALNCWDVFEMCLKHETIWTKSGETFWKTFGNIFRFQRLLEHSGKQLGNFWEFSWKLLTLFFLNNESMQHFWEISGILSFCLKTIKNVKHLAKLLGSFWDTFNFWKTFGDMFTEF